MHHRIRDPAYTFSSNYSFVFCAVILSERTPCFLHLSGIRQSLSHFSPLVFQKLPFHMAFFCFGDWADRIHQAAVLLLACLGENRGWLRVYETFVNQAVHILLYRIPGQTHGIADGTVTGIALIGLSVLTVHQIGIDRDFTGTQVQIENGIG